MNRSTYWNGASCSDSFCGRLHGTVPSPESVWVPWAWTILWCQVRHWWEKAYHVPWPWCWEGEESGGLLLEIPHYQSSSCQWPFMLLPECLSSWWWWLLCPVGLLPRPFGPGSCPTAGLARGTAAYLYAEVVSHVIRVVRPTTDEGGENWLLLWRFTTEALMLENFIRNDSAIKPWQAISKCWQYYLEELFKGEI